MTYLLKTHEICSMSPDNTERASLSDLTQDITAPSLALVSEYTQQLTKEYLVSCLETMYTKLAAKFQSELHKSTNVLSQEIATLGSRTDRLETEHDELSLAYGELSREHDHLQTAFSQLQAQVEDLDNRNRRNNLRVRGIPESVFDLSQTITKLFKSLLPDRDPGSFACDRIHRTLRPKPPNDKPPRDIVLCMKDFLTKEDIQSELLAKPQRSPSKARFYKSFQMFLRPRWRNIEK
ncbi:unnamed protein product [Staurois parvus]|uniref:Uncharacterized protein n=1 Tax=Staurois parvus TaxID=386267 RepID=A0ABN9DB69_9NEOB|nr:unnamed protein product [Staurois parvus]